MYGPSQAVQPPRGAQACIATHLQWMEGAGGGALELGPAGVGHGVVEFVKHAVAAEARAMALPTPPPTPHIGHSGRAMAWPAHAGHAMARTLRCTAHLPS